jgi:hypothetical protein
MQVAVRAALASLRFVIRVLANDQKHSTVALGLTLRIIDQGTSARSIDAIQKR